MKKTLFPITHKFVILNSDQVAEDSEGVIQEKMNLDISNQSRFEGASDNKLKIIDDESF